MSYAGYLIAAYAVFVLVLGWDFAATQWQIRRELRNARQRAQREAARRPAPDATQSRTIDPRTEPSR